MTALATAAETDDPVYAGIRLYVHPASSGGQILTTRNIAYGPHPDHRLNYYRNIVRSSGGNACNIILHGGSWSGNEKTTFVESTGSNDLGKFIYSLCLDAGTYGDVGTAVDVISGEYCCNAHAGAAAASSTPNGIVNGTEYEETYVPLPHTSGGALLRQRGPPTYLHSGIDAAQRIVQWVIKNSTRLGINPAKITIMGHSVGAWTSMNAAFSPSRPWDPLNRASGEYGATAEARVCGVINWQGEIDVDPWFNHHLTTRYLPGFMEGSSTDANCRLDMERLLLVPAADGTFPQGQPKTPLGRSLSPVDNIRSSAPERRSIRMYSMYRTDEPLDPNAPAAADYGGVGSPTNPPSIAPYGPYGGSGHDWRQLAILASACATAGVDHTSFLADWNEHYIDYGNPGVDKSAAIRRAIKASLVPLYAWIQGTINR